MKTLKVATKPIKIFKDIDNYIRKSDFPVYDTGNQIFVSDMIYQKIKQELCDCSSWDVKIPDRYDPIISLTTMPTIPTFKHDTHVGIFVEVDGSMRPRTLDICRYHSPHIEVSICIGYETRVFTIVNSTFIQELELDNNDIKICNYAYGRSQIIETLTD